MLRCPVCGAPLARVAEALACPARHSFDVSRHGYVNLLTGAGATSGDDAPMVRARGRFLESGAYTPIREAIADLAAGAPSPPTTVLDSGCGTGYYLAGVLDALRDGYGLGIDSSSRALQAAAKAHPRAAAVGWDIFRPFPVASASADLVLDTFAPRNPVEFRRVLRADGRLIVGRPTGRHLSRLLRSVEGTIGIDPVKEERLLGALDPWFEAVETRRIEFLAPLSHDAAGDLLAMTPSARHLGSGGEAKPPDEIDVSVLATVYRTR